MIPRLARGGVGGGAPWESPVERRGKGSGMEEKDSEFVSHRSAPVSSSPPSLHLPSSFEGYVFRRRR